MAFIMHPRWLAANTIKVEPSLVSRKFELSTFVQCGAQSFLWSWQSLSLSKLHCLLWGIHWASSIQPTTHMSVRSALKPSFYLRWVSQASFIWIYLNIFQFMAVYYSFAYAQSWRNNELWRIHIMKWIKFMNALTGSPWKPTNEVGRAALS